MHKFYIKIKDDDKMAIVLNLLRELPFVEIEDDVLKAEREDLRERVHGLEDLFGLWEDRNVTLNGIREKAWKRI